MFTAVPEVTLERSTILDINQNPCCRLLLLTAVILLWCVSLNTTFNAACIDANKRAAMCYNYFKMLAISHFIYLVTMYSIKNLVVDCMLLYSLFGTNSNAWCSCIVWLWSLTLKLMLVILNCTCIGFQRIEDSMNRKFVGPSPGILCKLFEVNHNTPGFEIYWVG